MQFTDFQKNSISQLKQNGLIKLSNYISPSILPSILSETSNFFKNKQFTSQNQIYIDSSILSISKSFSNLITDENLWKIASGYSSSHVKLSFFRLSRIDPIENYQSRAFQWHHDGWGINTINIMFLLSDLEENGQRMKYCPGSHLIKWQVKDSNDGIFYSKFVENNLEIVNCHGKKGDVYIFASNGIHSGTRNFNGRRDCLIIKFLPDYGRNYFIDEKWIYQGVYFNKYEEYVFGVKMLDKKFYEKPGKMLGEFRKILDLLLNDVYCQGNNEKGIGNEVCFFCFLYF